MHPIVAAFHVPLLDWVVQLEAYPLTHFLALLVLVAVTLRLYVRDIGPSGPALDVLLVAIPAGMLGANLLAAWTTGQAPASPLPAPRWWWMGGKSAYGGLLLGTAAGALVARLRGLSIARLFDAAAPGLALGACLARLGCFLGGCCWGRPTASFLGVHFPDGHPGRDALLPSDPRGLHPTQLYLAAAAFGIAVLLLVLRRRGPARPGRRFCSAAALYAATVFGVEFLRGDTGRWFGAGLSHSQWISLGIVAASLATAAWRPRALRAAVATGLVAAALGTARPAAAEPPWSRDAALDALQVIADAMAGNPMAGNPMAGNRGTATALLGELASIGGGSELSTWARLGLGADALLAGDLDRECPHGRLRPPPPRAPRRVRTPSWPSALERSSAATAAPPSAPSAPPARARTATPSRWQRSRSAGSWSRRATSAARSGASATRSPPPRDPAWRTTPRSGSPGACSDRAGAPRHTPWRPARSATTTGARATSARDATARCAGTALRGWGRSGPLRRCARGRQRRRWPGTRHSTRSSQR